MKIIRNKLGNIFENDSNKLNVKDKTSESPLFECMQVLWQLESVLHLW